MGDHGAREALSCGMYAISHPDSDQAFAMRAMQDAADRIDRAMGQAAEDARDFDLQEQLDKMDDYESLPLYKKLERIAWDLECESLKIAHYGQGVATTDGWKAAAWYHTRSQILEGEQDRLEELSRYVFKYMKDTGQTL